NLEARKKELLATADSLITVKQKGNSSPEAVNLARLLGSAEQRLLATIDGGLNAEIAELEQRIEDAGEPPKPEFVLHILIWLNELAYIYKAIGELDKSQQNILKSLEIAERLGLQKTVADAYGNLGLIYRTKGDLDKAEDMHNKSLEIEKKLGRLEGMASQYGNLGIVYCERGDLDKAEEMHLKALEIDKKLDRLEGMANDYANLGSVYEQRGDIGKAKEYWEKALGLFKKIGMPHMVEKVEGWIEGIDTE
ncbi:MAG: tetratricopeptide repeat protein, partial [Planctomycetes bacterium]|nr:tetratricopeptide repeat protein [Planctomycetota bacterium]